MTKEDWIRERFDVKELTKVKFFDKKRLKEPGYMEERIKTYFGFASIFEYGVMKISMDGLIIESDIGGFGAIIAVLKQAEDNEDYELCELVMKDIENYSIEDVKSRAHMKYRAHISLGN